MNLTSEQMQRITKEEILEMEPSIRGPDADEFREQVKRDIAKAAKDGIMLTIPNEWPDLGE